MASAVPHWEDQRHQTELLVNEVFNKTNKGNATDTAAAEAVMCFNTRRKFKQVQAKQHRASEEQRFLGAERRTLAGGGAMTLGSSSSFMGSASNRLGAGSAPPAVQAPTRGAGSHSLSSTSGVRGHFHSSLAAHKAGDTHRWPITITPALDGEHIDHTKAAPLKADPKYSKLNAEEKSKQFTCYFGKALTDNFGRKCAAKEDAARDVEKYKSWQAPDFRPDLPQRHGKFGRRVFDPQVKEKPVQNPLGISEIESQPVEEFFHQQERVHEFLDRALPPGQENHFKTYLPKAEFPLRDVDMATREPIRFVMDGDQKMPSLGWGQNRHSDHSDYKLYTRPLGTSHMDRLIPIAN